MIKFTQIIFLVLMAQICHSQQNTLPDFTKLVEKTGAAVVNITAIRTAESDSQNDTRQVNPLERFFGIPQNPQERDSVSGGSGFVISEDGYILTNRHVVHGANKITIRLVDRREYEAELIGEDEASDIALLKVDANNLPILKIGNANEAKIGQWVMAIGSPLSFEHSVTKGIISAKGRDFGAQQYVPYIQSDVPINRGNSGGPLINMNAEVIGVNTLILSNTGGYMGLSFSIPIDVAMSVVAQLKTGGSVKRGLLGVNIQNVTQKMAKVSGLDKPHGALVTGVNKDSAAQKAGIQIQDVIVGFNDKRVDRSASLPPMVGMVAPDTKVKLNIMRDGKEKVVYAVLDGLEGSEAVVASSNNADSAKLEIGFEVINLTDQQKEQFEIESGIVIQEIYDNDIKRESLRVGDVILRLSKTPIEDVQQFKRLINELDDKEPLVLYIQRGRNKSFVVIEK